MYDPPQKVKDSGAQHSAADVAKFREKMIERVSFQLELNTDQKQKLGVLANKLQEQRLALKGKSTDPRAELQGLISGVNGKKAVKLTIRDFGPGVSELELAKLGQPFYRVDSSRTRATGGVGLGLYLSRLVAQAHGALWKIQNGYPGLEIAIVFQEA